MPRPARSTTALVASVVLLVVLTTPTASWLQVRPAEGAVPSYGVASVLDDPHDREAQIAKASSDRGEEAGERFTFTPPASVCDPRSGVRDLPDALPSCALRLAVWDQPWWPIEPPRVDPVPELGVPEDLPPTRGPPLTASTAT
ncbi:hypothetical protein [Nocardiopsis coralli]|uniref:hypothetical protein n=1 Tax=Nocardiopsis coralli TaxID=2772213 RepID=UPI002E2DB76B|nr:hypothetical protein [Nocardiopsis coralli]